jgi:predicted GNAT family acetyltransferase
MQLQRFHDIHQFYYLAQVYLLAHEAEHNLFLGITYTLLQDPPQVPNLPYLAIVEDGGEIMAVAVQTPPYKLVLSKVKDLAALELVAQDWYRSQEKWVGVNGLVAEAKAFVEAWQQLTGQSYELAMQMRIHQLTAVHSGSPAKGYLRLATESDRPLLLEWFAAFLEEAFAARERDAIATSATQVESMVDRSLDKHHIYLWEDSAPMSFACGRPCLPTAARIGPVYTPPEYRRKGYATACVATLSQLFLDQECHSCFLFTDLANPTSNHIYQAIGYRPICDWHDYSFIA